jgi:uncharacterized protein YdbL (DUF1318 family)
MRKHLRLLLLPVLLLPVLAVPLVAAPASVAAQDDGGAEIVARLHRARADGLVGERWDGFAAVVPARPPADVKALVERINAWRRARYADIAAKNGTTVEAVGTITAKKLVERLPPGSYVMDQSGAWKRKP